MATRARKAAQWAGEVALLRAAPPQDAGRLPVRYGDVMGRRKRRACWHDHRQMKTVLKSVALIVGVIILATTGLIVYLRFFTPLREFL